MADGELGMLAEDGEEMMRVSLFGSGGLQSICDRAGAELACRGVVAHVRPVQRSI
jgi:hypothetical protein